MKKIILSTALAVLTFTGVAISYEAIAAEKNPAIVGRQGTYKTVAGHMTSLKAILFLGGSGNAAYHAGAIKSAWENMGNAFPPGSDKGETRAKAKIWEEMDAYKAKGKAAYGATVGLVSAIEGGDKGAIVEAYKKLGGSCKSCHDDYRKD